MNDGANTSQPCKCHWMEALADTCTSSVEYDEDRGAFYLNGSLAISYCIFCGGRLPEPACARESVAPDPDEEREAMEAVTAASSLNDLLVTLGEPDEIDNNEPTEFVAALHRMMDKYPDLYDNDPKYQYVRMFRYAKRWKSLCLDVCEYPDGRLEASATGLLPNEFVIVKQQSWWQCLRLRNWWRNRIVHGHR